MKLKQKNTENTQKKLIYSHVVIFYKFTTLFFALKK